MKQIFFAVLGLALFFGSCQDKDPVQTPVNLTSKIPNHVATSWSELYMDIEKDLPGFRPAATSRALAYIWMSAYETALPGMPDFVSNSEKLKGLTIPALDKPVDQYSWEVAVNAALAQSFKNMMPKMTPSHVGLVDYQEETFLDLSRSRYSQVVIDNSIKWGKDVANAVLNYANSDIKGVAQAADAFPATYNAPVGPFLWRTTPGQSLFPFWGEVRSFATFGQDLVAAAPPVASTDPNSRYYKDFKEVDDAIKNLTPESRHIAEFWSDDIVGLTFSPPARIFAIARQMATIEHYNLEQTLHLFLTLGIAENDAAVAAWGSKYKYNVERPTHFVTDHINPNFKTILGRAINTNNLTPPFPGYPSGHSTFGGLGISVLAHFFGEHYTFTDYCHYGRTEFDSAPRTYHTQTAIGEENAFSRIPLGVHPRFDCEEGLALGRKIGLNAVNYGLQK